MMEKAHKVFSNIVVLHTCLLPSAAGFAKEPPKKTYDVEPEVIPCEEPPPNMSCIPGGPFIRGSDDGPPNTRPSAIVFVQTFYMDKFEVTVAEYQECVRKGLCNPAGPRYLDFDRPRQPITGVSWFDAVKYCTAMGKHLPTEAEWEKAARGEKGALYPWGNDEITCERAVFMDAKGRSCGVKKTRGKNPEKGRPLEVGSRPAGVYGLFDMVGNVWEWVYDWYSSSYAACGKDCEGIDPKGPCHGADRCPSHNLKVVRGGSWFWPKQFNTSIFRRPHNPHNDPEFHHFGFRCAASVEEARRLKEKSSPKTMH
jgi:formylglycine-generating enzyme required for sulfatase activity